MQSREWVKFVKFMKKHPDDLMELASGVPEIRPAPGEMGPVFQREREV